MKVLNFGSLNIDYVYGVNSFVRPGETVSSLSFTKNIGGKGLNQSIALARAGVPVSHAGKVGQDGVFFIDYLKENGVNTENILIDKAESGHAIIQIDKHGQNCILLNGGANRRITKEEIDKILTSYGAGDWLILQNEISNVGYLIEKAHSRGMKIAINVAPADGSEGEYDLTKADIINVNETEGQALTGKKESAEILSALIEKYPHSAILLTLGAEGSVCCDKGKTYRQSIFPVKVVDTTSAGDTFFGYFFSEYTKSGDVQKALKLASLASSVCVSRSGASVSIPTRAEVKL